MIVSPAGRTTRASNGVTTMKTLVVEDDFTSRLLLQKILGVYGECDAAVDGMDAVATFLAAQRTKEPYQLICLDIMMPEVNGKDTLRAIRDLENASGRLPEARAKIVMTTSLADPRTVESCFHDLCDGYLVKPIERAELLACLRQLKLI